MTDSRLLVHTSTQKIRWGDIEVRMFLGDLGRTSIGTYYEIWMEGRKYAEGASKMVWINRGTGRSTPLPDAIAALLRVEDEQKR